MAQSIAFHSYKGGTGKTTIASNLAALLASKGHNVALLDLDVYAPSLQSYFEKTPKKWINDFLTGEANLHDIMEDMTMVIKKFGGGSTKLGKLWIGFSNPQKEEIYKLEGRSKQSQSNLEYLRKFISLKDDLIAEYDCEYIIIDTSPGIRYWSINSLAIANTLLLTLKYGDLDIEGTRKMAADIYNNLAKFGAKPYLLLNRLAGYCIPSTVVIPHSHDKSEGAVVPPQLDERDLGLNLSNEISVELLSAIPCYCDIQFSRKEFLTVLEYPNHPFAAQLDRIAASKPFKV